MNGQNKHSNDLLGLTGKWHTVPPEGPRPQSAIDYDRKSDTKKWTPDYGIQLGQYMRKAALLREEKKRARDNEATAKTDNQVI